MKIGLWACFVLFNFLALQAQDTVLFMNGENMIINDYSIDNSTQLLNYKNDKGKTRELDLEGIFAIQKKDGTESVIYYQDTLIENFLSIEEMRKVVDGQRIALNEFNSPGSIVVGALAGVTGSAIPSISVFWSFLPGAAAPAAFEFVQVSQKRIMKKYPDKKDDIYFINGYQDAASKKRVSNAAKGALAGFCIGVASRIVLTMIHNGNHPMNDKVYVIQ